MINVMMKSLCLMSTYIDWVMLKMESLCLMPV